MCELRDVSLYETTLVAQGNKRAELVERMQGDALDVSPKESYSARIADPRVALWNIKTSERALPETDFRRCVRTSGGQVQSSG